MKKIFAFVLILSLYLSLCGCMALDEMRASRVIIVSDDVLRLADGTEYKRLPECEEFVISMYDKADYYAAEEDVPLLLLWSVGAWVSISRDGLALRNYDNNAYYCRADVYDSVVERIENGVVTDVYGYWEFDAEVGGRVIRTLTSAQAAAVEQICATQEPEKLPAAATLRYDYKQDLWLFSSDYLFRRDTLDLCLTNGEYFLVTEDNSIYTVPAELNALFAEILYEMPDGDWPAPGME